MPQHAGTAIPELHQRGEGFGAAGEVGDVALVQLAVEADADQAAVLPPDHRRPAERSAIQGHRRPRRQLHQAIQLRPAGGEVEDLHRMALAAGLEERRQGHRNPRMSAAVGIRIRVLRGRNGGWHHVSLMAVA